MWACIVSNDSASSGRIQRALANEGPEPAPILSLDRAAAQIAELRPALVIVGLLPDMERGLAVVSEIRGVTPAQIVAVGPEGNAKLVLRAMHQGANDYVSSQELESELNEALGRLEMKSLSQGTLGKVIGLLAPSGGSGSSTLAVNIATILAKEHERSVLLDLKLSGGDLAPLLDLKPEHNLAELCQNTGAWIGSCSSVAWCAIPAGSTCCPAAVVAGHRLRDRPGGAAGVEVGSLAVPICRHRSRSFVSR